MKTTYPIEEFIEFMEDMMNDLDQLLESPTVEKKSAIKWREDTRKKISTVFGENHPYVREFEAIDFATPFIDGSDRVMVEDTYRLGLEDGKSYLIAMMDELESEYYHVFGMMDIETTFYEMGRYIIAKTEDDAVREDLLQRISVLSEGLVSGDIDGKVISEQLRYIGQMDKDLFKMIVPIFAWYYVGADKSGDTIPN
ncbi:MAG TPA: hypothetical protein VIS94_15875 [Desulfomonilia bacterium]|jgi:hypothetical protein